MLGQQRSKDVDRVVATLKTLGVTRVGHPAAAGLRDARFGGVDARRGRLHRRVPHESLPYGLLQAQGFLPQQGETGNGEVQQSLDQHVNDFVR